MGANWTTHEDTILKLANEMKIGATDISERYLPTRSLEAIVRRLGALNHGPDAPSKLQQKPPIAIPMTAEEENLANRSAGLNARMWAYYNKRGRQANCTPLEAAVLFCGMRA